MKLFRVYFSCPASAYCIAWVSAVSKEEATKKVEAIPGFQKVLDVLVIPERYHGVWCFHDVSQYHSLPSTKQP